MRKVVTVGVTLLVALLLSACGNSSSSSKKSSSSSAKTEKLIDKTGTKDEKNEQLKKAKSEGFYLSGDTYHTNNLTYKITDKELRNSNDAGKNVLVLKMDITNTTTKKVDLQSDDALYTYIHAYQKTKNTEKKLDPGIIKSNADGSSPEQAREDASTSKLLPHKTVKGIMVFSLINSSQVKVTFSDKNYNEIFSKNYDF